MMCQNFETVPVPYRTTSELLPTLFPELSYYGDIPAPYAERLATDLRGLWVDGDSVVVTGETNMVWWPSYEFLSWQFNVNTGAFVARGGFPGYPYATDVNQGAGGELYMTYVTGPIYPLGPAPTYEVLVADEILPSRWGYVSILAPFFDRSRDRAVLNGPSGALSTLRVFEFTSGDWIRDIPMPATVMCIVHDDATRVFVLLENKAVVSVNYETGQVYGYCRIPQIIDATTARIAWHKAYRRLLVVEHTPDNVDGTSTTVIRGYRYSNVPLSVCEPIPLTRLRDGKQSTVLVKQVGDLGEGIAGLATLTSDEVSAAVARPNVALDGDGEGYGEITGTAEGDETVTASVEVACLL